ncbi:MAG TPA: hypothetical protein VEB86_09190 [Chryseosolibacter sp.]|nr:hypothetical protein [Chryseosolibacter sp.]
MKLFFCSMFSVAVALFVLTIAEAQQIKRQVKPETAALVKDRKLVVFLKSEDESVMRKLTGAELKNYKQGISQFNTNLQTVVKAFWTFNSTVSYLTKDKIESLKPANEYAILAVDLINIRFSNQLTRRPANQILRLHVCMLEDYDPLKPVFYQDVVGFVSEQGVPAISKMDLVAAANMVQNHLQARLDGKRRANGLHYEEALEYAGTLKNKTLLIDTTFMDKKLTAQEVKEAYTYPFAISNSAAIEKAQMSRDKKFAYVYVFPVGDASNTMYHCILDCETGKVISYSMNAGLHLNNFIDRRHLEEYVLYSDYYNNKKNKKGKGK